MQLMWQDSAISIGPRVKLKKNTFQGIVCQLVNPSKVDELVTFIKQLPRFRHALRFPCSYRVRKPTDIDQSTIEGNGKDRTNDNNDIDPRQPRGDGFVTNSDGIEEFEMDDKEPLLGGKLLHLLQQWQVEGILLIVARIDDSLSGLLIGGELYKLYMESAKLALEEFYVTHLQPAPAVDFELQVSPPKSAPVVDPPALIKVVMSSEIIPAQKRQSNQQLHQQQVQAMVPHRQEIQSTDWLGISRDEYTNLRRIRVPTREFHLLMVCLAILLKRDDFSWNSCRQLFQSKQLSAQLHLISVRTVTKNQIDSIRTILQEPNLTYHAFLRISTAVAKIYAWIARLLDEFDENQLGLQSAPQDILITNSSANSKTSSTASPVKSTVIDGTTTPRGHASPNKLVASSDTSKLHLPHPPSTPSAMVITSIACDVPPPSSLRNRSKIVDHGRLMPFHGK